MGCYINGKLYVIVSKLKKNT